jgi:hypothetical protein
MARQGQTIVAGESPADAVKLAVIDQAKSSPVDAAPSKSWIVGVAVAAAGLIVLFIGWKSQKERKSNGQ